MLQTSENDRIAIQIFVQIVLFSVVIHKILIPSRITRVDVISEMRI